MRSSALPICEATSGTLAGAGGAVVCGGTGERSVKWPAATICWRAMRRADMYGPKRDLGTESSNLNSPALCDWSSRGGVWPSHCLRSSRACMYSRHLRPVM